MLSSSQLTHTLQDDPIEHCQVDPNSTALPIYYSPSNTQAHLDISTNSASFSYLNITQQGISLQKNMTSSHSQQFSSQPVISSMEQHVFPNYSHMQPNMPTSFYESFPLMPAQMQMQMNRQQQVMGMNGAVQQQQQQELQQQTQQQQSVKMEWPSVSQPMSRQESVDYDDDYDGEEEEDNSEVMIPKDDIETRLKVAQEAQDAAASEGPNGVFACPYCDKRYAGKHARSIWRRHLQDKHAIPLSQQPRRTRWDGDANRPKNAEERRQRMLESKRRWARKKRQAEKTGGKVSAEDSYGEVSPIESSFQDKPAPLPVPVAKKRTVKTKGPQQLKFHNITQNEMPPYADFGSSAPVSGGGGMLWPTANDATFQIARDANSGVSNRSKPFSSSTLSAAHNFSRKGIHMPQPQPQIVSMMATVSSPRKALAQIDTNAANGRRMVRQSVDMGIAPEQDVKAMMNGYTGHLPTMDMNKMTPMTRFNQIYPTPPSTGDPKMFNETARREMGKSASLLECSNTNNLPLLSPPASHHTGESSPSYFGSNGMNMTALGKRNSTVASYSPVVSRTETSGQRSPVDNPFSLDRHKISPTTLPHRKGASEALQPPTSASRLTSALDGTNEHKLSPIQNRAKSHAEAKGNASPLGKGRKLPPLVKTPLRPIKMEDRPTPSTAMDLIGAVGSVSMRRIRSTAGSTDPWKGLMTPTVEHNDRMLGGTSLTGYTPFSIKSAKYSTTRGLASVTRPSRDNGDQFSSPQHLNLTQSLGLAPHSTGKGAFGGIGATPFISSFLTSNSPWPESVVRPSFKTSASKRGREEDAVVGDGSSVGDDEDEDDENSGEVFLHETPSRPAKHRRSVVLGSNGSSAQTSRSSRLLSSATREQLPVKPISFNLSSDREEKKQAESSLDSDLTTGKSSLLSTSRSPSQSDDGSDGIQSPTISPTKRLLI